MPDNYKKLLFGPWSEDRSMKKEIVKVKKIRNVFVTIRN